MWTTPHTLQGGSRKSYCSDGMSAEASADAAGDADEEEAPQEPTLKYQRLGGSLPSILAADKASCLAAHSKFLSLGTDAGAVHVLDLAGNEIRRFTPHSAPVTDICIDATGEFVGSCSQDGTVVVSSLFGGEASTHWYHRPVRAIALDPDYSARRVFATGGLACQLVINSRGWFGSKDNVVHSGEVRDAERRI
jgi:WD40 repeat protein